MGVVASGGRVGEHLESLQERFGSFAVDQSTITVSPAVYERASERAEAGIVDAVVRVWNDDGAVLHVRDDEWELPRRRGLDVEGLRNVLERAVSTGFGVDCLVDGIERVTIAGIQNREGRELDPVYRLVAVVDASHADGVPHTGEWRAIDPHRTRTLTV